MEDFGLSYPATQVDFFRVSVAMTNKKDFIAALRSKKRQK